MANYECTQFCHKQNMKYQTSIFRFSKSIKSVCFTVSSLISKIITVLAFRLVVNTFFDEQKGLSITIGISKLIKKHNSYIASILLAKCVIMCFIYTFFCRLNNKGWFPFQIWSYITFCETASYLKAILRLCFDAYNSNFCSWKSFDSAAREGGLKCRN